MKDALISFVVRTQKALAAVLGALTSVAAGAFLPEPYAQYVAVAIALLTGLVTYVLPYVAETLAELPEDEPENPDAVPAAELLERLEEEAHQPAETPADAVAAPEGPLTQPMPIEDVLAALTD